MVVALPGAIQACHAHGCVSISLGICQCLAHDRPPALTCKNEVLSVTDKQPVSWNSNKNHAAVLKLRRRASKTTSKRVSCR